MLLTMLGTGHAMVTNCFNTCFTLKKNNEYFLVDSGGGNGLLSQMKKAGINPNEISAVFISHKHVDHITGCLWLFRIFIQNAARGKLNHPVTFYSHFEIIEFLQKTIHFLFDDYDLIDKTIRFVSVKDKETITILNCPVTFFDIHAQKVKQFGFKMQINDDASLVFAGDESLNESEYPYIENCTWLLTEAFCMHKDADTFHPYRIGHSTVKTACETAEKLNVHNLVLYHTEDSDLTNRKNNYINEGKQFFSGNIFVPDDLDQIKL